MLSPPSFFQFPSLHHANNRCLTIKQRSNVLLPIRFIWGYVTKSILVNVVMKYRTRAIIARSRFETALDYKPRIFKVRKVSLYYKRPCNINHGL